MDDAAADAEEAGAEADDRAVDDAAPDADGVPVVLAVAVGEFAWAEVSAERAAVSRLAEQEPRRDEEQNGRHQDVEQRAGDRADGERACDRARHGGAGEGEAAAVVDSALVGVGGGAGSSVEEDGGEADRGDRRGPVVRVDQQQHRGDDETATGAKERSEGAHAGAKQDEQDRDGRREGHRDTLAAPRVRSGRVTLRLPRARALADGGELGAYLSSDRGEFRVLDEREHRLGVDRGDVRLAVGAVDDDVAGKQRAELGSALRARARWASGGLQAPRMRYGSCSTPSFSRRVACTSISQSTPKPSLFSSSRTRSTASLKGASVVAVRV
jgi:hypothetical protein